MRVTARRSVFGVVSAVGVLAAWGAVPVAGQSIPVGSASVRLLPFSTIPTADGSPQDLVTANDGTGRLFVATRNGRIRVTDAAGNLSATTFLTIPNVYNGGEGGFSGIAFSPNFSAPAATPGSGKFYTFTTETYSAANAVDFSHPELAPTTGVTPNNHTVIREWSVNPATPNVADTTSRVVMRMNHPQSNHQGGGLKFGLDGNLYVALGDGGGGNDFNGSPTSNTDGHTNSTGNAQDLTNVFGKILRINPTGTGSTNGQYGIPANVIANTPGAADEIFAYGLRNPYRISFDRGTGSLYAGDVGQNAREEVDIVTNGGNYGWVFREGTRDNTADSGRSLPTGFSSIAPIAEYGRSDGTTIIGGFVYRGTAMPTLFGKYVFGDTGTGRLFYMDALGGPVQQLGVDQTGGGVGLPGGLYGFGEDARGELYAYFAGGSVLRLVPEPAGVMGVAVAGGVSALRRRRR